MKAGLFFLIVLIGIVGPILLPIALLKRIKAINGPIAFGLTNLITASPMIGMTLWVRYFPGPRCPEIYPDAPCDGIPSDAAWLIFAVMFGVLALWGVIATMITTFWVVKQRNSPRP